ncbi:SecA Wing/Scaffold [Pavlovales sp. CCMP2436]|nr:SecA Wing/Scaffold [Pavlovales sp. CCMP2436]
MYALRRRVLASDSAQILKLMQEQSETTVNGIVAEANKAGKDADAAATVGKLQQFFGGPALLPLAPAALAPGRSGLSADAATTAAEGALQTKTQALDGTRADLAAATARYLLLVQLDVQWKKHIADVRTVQDMVGLRAIAGRDPLIEFRQEISTLYDRMLKVAAYNTVFSFFSYNPASKP